MKTIQRVILAACILLSACTSAKKELRSGDLVFVGLPMDYASGDGMDAAIVASTGDGQLNLIHVAIVEVAPDSVYVIDATAKRGVQRHSLQSFLQDFTLKSGEYPTFIVKRLTVPVPDAVENAKAFCGQPYDSLFLPRNGAQYCSELIHDSYLSPSGEFLFEEYPMNWKDADGNYPPYWVRLFGRLGVPIPQDVPGTNPQRMAASPLLEDVDVYLPACVK